MAKIANASGRFLYTAFHNFLHMFSGALEVFISIFHTLSAIIIQGSAIN